MGLRMAVQSWACWAVGALLLVPGAPSAPPAESSTRRATDTVVLDYPDQIPLEALADFVSRSLDIRVLYGDELRGKQVTLRPGSVELPRDRLLDLLRSVLKVRDLALVRDELPGYYRIVPIEQAPRLAEEVRDPGGPPPEEAAGEGRIVTQVIRLRSGETKGAAQHLKPFMSSEKGSIVEIPDRGLLIVTDYAPAVARIARIAELIDAAPEPIVTELIALERATPAQVSDQIQRILTERVNAGDTRLSSVSVVPGIVAGKLVVTAPADRLPDVLELIHRFDSRPESGQQMRSYTARHASVERLKGLIETVLFRDPQIDAGGARVLTDPATNRLYVTATAAVHAAVEQLLAREDQPAQTSARPLRLYRPRNRTAAELLDTLAQLLEDASVTLFTEDTGRHDDPRQTENQAAPVRLMPPRPPGSLKEEPEPPIAQLRRIEGPDYVMTEDEHSNAIIAIGTLAFHARLSELIEALDTRRAQVMIEMMLVAVTLNDSLALGVELKQREFSDNHLEFLFSDFGLSSFDVTTGSVVMEPGVGINGALLAPDEFAVVVRALATHGNSKVVATPRILVADNSEGVLRSVDEAPFTSVNASDTVATTSFGGFESAGTTLTVTPHVGEGDHLSLRYNLSFSSFTGGSASTTAPPPRTTNSFNAEVEVPDGYTVVVGGLVVENEADSVDEIPLLGRIPVLGALFQSSSTARTRTRVYAFIRPVILRDDRFEDLKFITAGQLEEAELENTDYPADRYMWMR